MTRKSFRTILLGAAMSGWTGASLAQEAATTPPPPPAHVQDEGLQEIVVTGTAKPTSKLDASVAISTLSEDQLEQVAPSSTADILRDIPGIRAEASGGEGNANIAVRGLPVASGGGKFVQFQQDGLPVLLFGDIAFGTADTWIKADYNLNNIEVVRGGAASTFASDAPGAIINFIDKTGTEEGGAVGLTSGLNYDQERFDADYGGKIADGWRFHVGGFYREGDGPRDVDYLAENGGQIKANVTRDLANGFIRLNVEYLNDRTPAYLPVPVQETSSGFSSLPGFDALTGTLQSTGLLSTLALDHNGNRITTDLSDGYHVETKAVGGEGSFDLGSDWTLDDKFRVAINSGDFVGPYPADVDTAQNLANSIGGAGSSLRYATGGSAGQKITNPGALNGNGLAVNTVLFNVTIPDFNNYSNVLNVAKTLHTEDAGDITLTAGYFKSVQDLTMDWHWTDFLLDVSGSNPQLLDVYNAKGQKVTQGGLVAYYASGFGCVSCTRYYDVQYNADAPFANVNWHVGKLNLDGSLRYDILNASGTYQQAATTTLQDLTGGGGVPEETASTTSGPSQPANYTKYALSYSFGGNYELMDDLALFARVSRGARFNADRALPANPDGSIPDYQAIARVEQQEGGVKWQESHFNLFVTGFHATTDEYGTDITNTGLQIYDRSYESFGIETEAGVHYGPFRVNGGLTWTHARITADPSTPANVGQEPQRQAEWVYQVTPSYNTEDYSVGFNVIGTSSAPAAQPSAVRQPGYAVVGLFGQYFVTDQIRLSLNVNNLFDEFAVTEVDQGSGAIPANGLATARTITGRTIELGLKYTF
jgi:outer membrane receptor protein involved in Fe transport